MSNVPSSGGPEGNPLAQGQPLSQGMPPGTGQSPAAHNYDYANFTSADLQYGARNRTPAWAAGFIAFAAAMLILVGIFQFINGLSAVLEDDFYVTTQNYTYEVDVTTWGWIHMTIGVLMMIAGAGLVTGSTFARIIAVVVAGASMIANFFFIPHYPVWSILIIALDVVVIWAVIAHGGDFRMKDSDSSQPAM